MERKMANTPVDGTRSPIRGLGFTLGGVPLFITFLVIVAYTRDPNHYILWLKIAAAVWAVAPPTWFALEWYWYHFLDSEKFEQFKYSQDCMRAVWAGVGAILAGILIGH
jgi:hypothetical protein